MSEKIVAVLKGRDRHDGAEITLKSLIEQVCTPGPPPAWFYGPYPPTPDEGLADPADLLPRTLYWRLVRAEDGMPSRDDQGRYCYELT